MFHEMIAMYYILLNSASFGLHRSWITTAHALPFDIASLHMCSNVRYWYRVLYMFYHKMQISWPGYGSRPIGLLDKQIKTFAEQRGI